VKGKQLETGEDAGTMFFDATSAASKAGMEKTKNGGDRK